LQPATCNLQPATCNLQPAACHLPPAFQGLSGLIPDAKASSCAGFFRAGTVSTADGVGISMNKIHGSMKSNHFYSMTGSGIYSAPFLT
ncbi:MAG: hypothetical protein ABF430_12750, partial [Acetobacter persici]|uniref:hypothetical protein n=1 Tax=Acetobacter persici TaxID=1076596 RepID=UPI0039E9B15E